ncbi:hypothetical protein BO99DRAFT_407926 [Aspergillus violaceofuscus CBS 115571]|uniref:Uncharacterized protein n=1 Tax=Aspergillus violaceofuscus (strain CBS 115571) TaxID=1450538 RepID=A0A2V5HLT9_ASPV1|nr:hypothetical protein BO99DRAFT_407926 [Aspergillus violaceofuscus CBS 115571]
MLNHYSNPGDFVQRPNWTNSPPRRPESIKDSPLGRILRRPRRLREQYSHGLALFLLMLLHRARTSSPVGADGRPTERRIPAQRDKIE